MEKFIKQVKKGLAAFMAVIVVVVAYVPVMAAETSKLVDKSANGVTYVATDSNSTFAIRADGSLWAWGGELWKFRRWHNNRQA